MRMDGTATLSNPIVEIRETSALNALDVDRFDIWRRLQYIGATILELGCQCYGQ